MAFVPPSLFEVLAASRRAACPFGLAFKNWWTRDSALVTIPLGALLAPTTVEITIPAGQYMEVDLTVNGGQHMKFLQPVVVTIDYSRCTRFDTLLKPLSVWNIDPTTKALLENMGGLDNKLAQLITFFTLTSPASP